MTWDLAGIGLLVLIGIGLGVAGSNVLACRSEPLRTIDLRSRAVVQALGDLALAVDRANADTNVSLRAVVVAIESIDP